MDSAAQFDELSQFCRAQQPAMLEWLERLVLQESHSHDVENGTKCAALLRQAITEVDGMAVREFASERFGPHLLASSRAATESPAGCVGLIGHYDTVFPRGTFTGFRREGDIARGPGVLDMKGGLVVTIFALRALAHVGQLTRLPLRLLIVSDEEVGSPESFAILQREMQAASCALVFEAGRKRDAIITARKGTGGIKVVVSGRAAHAGNHHREGVNAIWALAKVIDRVQQLTDYGRGITVNVGTIGGGQSRNTVPEHAEALFDLRFINLADGDDLVARFQHEARAAVADIDGASVTFEGGVARPPLERTEANVALCQEYGEHAAAAGLGNVEADLIGGGSDASSAGSMGVPAIDGLGPRGSGFHTREEYIEVSSLTMRCEALARFLLQRALGQRRKV